MQAGWVLPVEAAPIPDAAVLVDDAGRIVAVGPSAAVSAPPDAEQLSFPRALLLPGLVNTHTHLELTGFTPAGTEHDFPRWITGIRRRKLERSPAEYLAAARRGLQDCWAAGVTTIADTGDSGAVLQALHELGGSGIAFHEVFGPDPDQCPATLRAFIERMAELAAFQSPRVRLGASPHAPYSVSGPLYAATARWAHERGLPLAVHLAESAAESELITASAGPFAEAWSSRGIPLPREARQAPPDPAARRSPVAWLASHGVLAADTLAIHAIRVDQGDLALLTRYQVAIAHCPLSNAAHGHGAAPLGALRAAGVRVGLGTDSVASVATLDLLAEARAAQALAGLSNREALALATRDGARALGLDREIGTLTPGKWADLAVLEAGEQEREPEAAALRSPRETVLTVLGGRIVHRATGA